MSETYNLYQITTKIKSIIEENFYEYYNITAEISTININRNGHCYLELIQKDEISENIIAKARAIIWKSNFRLIQAYFYSVTGKDLQPGLKILFSASIEYSQLYGFSLNIVDIDPNYTLGDLERQKRETLAKLEKDGVISMNKELELPIVIKNIAIISSDTAAGYEDFLKQLNNNKLGFKFHTKLFKAYMQGNEAEQSILNAFDKIFQYSDIFDIIVFIRGGGSKADLAVFDLYNIAYYITQMPIPVITGIGHERDNSIADIVAFEAMKTPTAVADFIISHNENFWTYMLELEQSFQDEVLKNIKNENHKIELLANKFSFVINNFVKDKNNSLSLITSKLNQVIKDRTSNETKYFEQLKQNITYSVQKNIDSKKYELKQISNKTKNRLNNLISNQKHKINLYELKNNSSDPKLILKKGYSYLTINGKHISSVKHIKQNDTISNHLYDGVIVSKVSKKTK